MNAMNKGFNLRQMALLEAGESSISLLPVIEKEIIHYDIIKAMSANGFLDKLCFQGGTALRLCYHSERFSEDLDFTGGVNFESSTMNQLKECIENTLSSKYGVAVVVKPPKIKKEEGINVSSWQVKVVTSPERPDLPSQKIKIEVANVPSYTRQVIQLTDNYKFTTAQPVLIGVQTMTEIMADKLLAFPASTSHIRFRDIWDLNWMSLNKIKPDSNLLEKKIKDYGIKDYNLLLANRINQAPDIISSNEFKAQMSRFLRSETIANSFGNKDFISALTGNIIRLFESVETSLAFDSSIPQASMPTAQDIAKQKGEYFFANPAENKTFEGKILGVTDQHVVVSLGRSALIVNKRDVDRVPAVEDNVKLAFAGGKGVFEVVKGVGVER